MTVDDHTGGGRRTVLTQPIQRTARLGAEVTRNSVCCLHAYNAFESCERSKESCVPPLLPSGDSSSPRDPHSQRLSHNASQNLQCSVAAEGVCVR